jgi:hypothetical protein
VRIPTNEQPRKFDHQLATRGWTYDVGDEVFRDDDRIVPCRELLRLTGMTADELVSWQDDQYDRMRR